MAENDLTRDLRKLRRARETLEKHVQERNAELAEANHNLPKEIEARRRAEEELRLLLRLTHAVTAANDFDSALAITIHDVCEHAGWDYGEAWVPNPTKDTLVLSSAWHSKNLDHEKFESARTGVSFAPNVGLPGRVWATRRPEWNRDISLRSGAVRRLKLMELGVKATFGVPIIAGTEVVAILLFGMFQSRAEDRLQIEIVSAVAAQLGAIFHHKQTEDELHKSEALLRAILDNSTRVIYLKDQAGRYLTVNRQFESLFHVTRQEIQGITDHDLFPKEIADKFRANDLQVLQGRMPLEFEEVAKQDDGLHTYTSNKYPMFDAKEVLYGVCGISTDITELKRQEEQLQERLQHEESFSQSVLNTAPVVVLLLDTDGRIVYANPCFEQLSGYRLEEARGRDWFVTFLPQRDRERIRRVFQQALTGSTVVGNTNPIVAKDGREREIEWNANLLRDKSGKVIGVLSCGLDVSEWRKAESWFQSLVQAAPDALVSIDRQGCIVEFNPAAEKIFGYGKEEAAGQKLNMLMPEPYGSEHDDYIARYERTGEAHAIGRNRTVTGKRKNGKLFPMELSIIEIPMDEDVHYAAFMRDTSEKVKLQEHLVESERLAAIGTTMAKLGHEIGNPLNGIYLTVQLLEQLLARQPTPPDSQLTANVKKVKVEVSRLNRLLQDFRALSRREKLNFRSTTLSTVAIEALELESPRYAELGIRLHYDFPADLPAVTVDIDKMKQVFVNLCQNAVEAMPGGGMISIKASASATAVALEIADTGVGIAPNIDIFEPFITTKRNGTGLGLVIVRHVITAHGGTIAYRSQPGKGSTFFITLPRS
jgi:PAS domain S-box-containing protein